MEVMYSFKTFITWEGVTVISLDHFVHAVVESMLAHKLQCFTLRR